MCICVLLSAATLQSNISYADTWSSKAKETYVNKCVDGANRRMHQILNNKKLDPKVKAKILQLQSAYEPMCRCLMNEITKKWTPTGIKNNGSEYIDYLKKIASPKGACDVQKFIPSQNSSIK